MRYDSAQGNQYKFWSQNESLKDTPWRLHLVHIPIGRPKLCIELIFAMFYSNNAFSTVVLFFIYLIALLLSTLFPMASAMPIRGRSSPQEVRAYPPVSREFVRIHRDRDGTIKLAQASPGDGLYSVYNETHAQYHSGDNLDPDTTNMQRRSIEPFLPRHKNPKRQFDGSCAAQCGTKSANPADIRAAEAALDAQFSSSQYGLSWGVGQYIGTDGSVFQVVNNVYAYGCDQGGKGQTTTSEEYAFQVQCLTESCGSYMGSNRDKSAKRIFGRDVGSFKCN
ncbi:MAG: hypothetical protein NXY57DRAFT_286114 [Lentinula lateritia]|nr:MAG: hypothetical protein NXY57DRAFT_286114 [Lentinula lateritia]